MQAVKWCQLWKYLDLNEFVCRVLILCEHVEERFLVFHKEFDHHSCWCLLCLHTMCHCPPGMPKFEFAASAPVKHIVRLQSAMDGSTAVGNRALTKQRFVCAKAKVTQLHSVTPKGERNESAMQCQTCLHPANWQHVQLSLRALLVQRACVGHGSGMLEILSPPVCLPYSKVKQLMLDCTLHSHNKKLCTRSS